jgi:hypothetical protein
MISLWRTNRISIIVIEFITHYHGGATGGMGKTMSAVSIPLDSTRVKTLFPSPRAFVVNKSS